MIALELSYVFAAPRAVVWAAFTDPAVVSQWWGPPGFCVTDIDFRPREGGPYRVGLVAPDGTRYVHEGTFVEVSPPQRISYTWRWIDGPLGANATHVTLTFHEQTGETLVELRHEGFPSTTERDAHVGWRGGFDRLSSLLSSAHHLP